jgi:5,10-methylenetetrahydromethanopterin reductase
LVVPVRSGAQATAPRFALVLLVERAEDCGQLATEAERGGFEMLGIVDSQSVSADVHVCLTAAALATARIRLGPAVTNPVTRHPVVTANAMASLDRLAPGRVFLGLGAGDSAVFTLGLRPAPLGSLEQSARDLQTLMAGGTVERAGQRVRIKNGARPIPLYLAADGPRARQLAGRVADGVFVGSGFTPAEVARSREDVAAGARATGRAPETLDIWWLVKANVAASRAAAIDEIKGTLVSSGNRVFRAVAAPEPFREAIAGLQRGYNPLEHAALGAAGNARLSGDADLTAYLAERFAIAGTPDDCADQVRRAVAAGADKLLLTAITPDPQQFIRRWASEVMPRCLQRIAR